MKFKQLSPETVDRFIGQLKQGFYWSNGLVGHETITYQDGQFVSSFQDQREREYGPYTRTFSEEGLRRYLLERLFVEHEYHGLLRSLDADAARRAGNDKGA